MNDYTSFFLNSKSSTIQFELIEIYHPNFSKIYRVVRNSTEGIVVKLETNEVAEFEYYPVKIDLGSSQDDLDQSIVFTIGDLGEVVPKELDLVTKADGFGINPTVKYRVYRSDNLDAPMLGPVLLEIERFAFNQDGVSFEAKAPSLNVNKTGELYKLDRFPMLRGYL